jgi:hypothetical protein
LAPFRDGEEIVDIKVFELLDEDDVVEPSDF